MKITRDHIENGDRYAFDFKRCPYEKGWCQVDTTRDAWYFGQWANPESLKIVEYCEGDVTVQECESPEEFTEAMEELHKFESEGGRWLGVDSGIGKIGVKMEAAWRRLGLSRLFHQHDH